MPASTTKRAYFSLMEIVFASAFTDCANTRGFAAILFAMQNYSETNSFEVAEPTLHGPMLHKQELESFLASKIGKVVKM